MKSKYNGNIELLDILFKTEQFQDINDEIIKDSFKAILSILKYQNEKLNEIDNNIYNKISREEFNENLKHKVNYSEFMSQLNNIGYKDTKIENKNLLFPMNSNNSNYNETLYSNNNSFDDLNKDIQNLKIECSMLSKKIENIMLIQSDLYPNDISNRKENPIFNRIKEKLEKNEKDITNLALEFQNNFIKIEDKINDLNINQLDKTEINQNINEALKRIDENNTKNIQDEFLKINKSIKKQITDNIIEMNKNLIKDGNNNYDIKYDFIIKEILSKNNIFEEMINEMNSKFYNKIDKEEIIDIYSNIQEIKNNMIRNKNENDMKIKKIMNDINIYIKNENKNIKNNYKIMEQEDEIKNIKININENSNLLNNLKEELINIQKDKNHLMENENKNLSNFFSVLENNNNVYPKNDIKNEISYLKRFINMFMLETKKENQKGLEILCNTLKEKINIIDINNILKEISIDMSNKVNLDLFYKHIQIQNEINNFISKEHIIGKWVSHKNTPMKSGFILWDEQLINFAPNNYCFSADNSHIFIKEKGIYLIKIIIFNNFSKNNINNVQLVIDRKKFYNHSHEKRKMIIKDNIDTHNSYEESIIFEECIYIKNFCRVEIRVDGFNNMGNNDIRIDENKNDILRDNDNLKAILSIISM